MNLIFKILLLLATTVAIHSAITVNPITGISDHNLVFSGSIPVGSNSLFFTYYGVDGQTNQDNLKNHPLLVVVGNPGTSAQYYSLGGIGPMNLKNDLTLETNPNSFTASANVMFLDLLGSGFSFASDPSDLPTDAKGYGEVLATALNTFEKEESVLGQSKVVVLAGQSTFIRTLPGFTDIKVLSGIIHVSSWPELYAVGRYYGIGGLDLHLYGDSERIAIDSTFTTCYNNIRSSKFLEAHQCVDAIYNFVESKTKNGNLFDTRLKSNLTEFLPMIQYYFSQKSVIDHWKAPTVKLFESQSGYIFNKTYVDMPKNYTTQITQFFRDQFSVRHWFIQGRYDYIAYYKGIRNWVENELNFVERDAFRKAALEDIVIEGKTVGYSKAVKQVAYSQILDAGHHAFHDTPQILAPLFKSWIESFSTAEVEKNISTE